MLNKKEKLGIIIIAAGNSSRLGEPKQLVQFNKINLLQHSLNLAEQFSDQVICVLGNDSANMKNQIKTNTQQLIVNQDWLSGMGSSISVGVKQLSRNVDAILILLCDQYLINGSDLKLLIEQWYKNKKKIIASQYFENKQGKLIEGAPAIFPKTYFDELMKLRRRGARDILSKNKQILISTLIENAAFDLDTKNDLKLLRTMEINGARN